MAGLAAPAIASPGGGARALLKSGAPFSVESDRTDIHDFDHIHQGLGSIGVRLFGFGGAPAPANFLIYDIPPGCSEGVHLHNAIDPTLGAFDEYYYIIAGTGVMPIGDTIVAVSPGDHVHTPMGVRHGIENTGTDTLRVFLTYVNRAPYAGKP
ncbi:MAG TPA: cupin domain-containing protein [Sphingomonas sp.]|nr:cupin domain-containing protein [Sphingomonas sp.]